MKGKADRKKNREVRIRISDELHARLQKLAGENNLLIGAQAGFYVAQGIQHDEYRLKKLDSDIVGGGKKSPPKSKFQSSNHPRKIIDFEEAKRRLAKRYCII